MILDDILSAQKQGNAIGIPSICSAHPAVIEACLLHALENDTWLLIESTCNQVNQYGGYTGVRPLDFVNFLGRMAEKLNYPVGRLVMGGDHLGPEVWQHEPAKGAMQKACVLVGDYVQAGYVKIHLDASMKLGDDPEGPLPKEIVAVRSVELALVAEDAYSQRGCGEPPRYVIGTEVPIPGGARAAEDHLQVTVASDAAETIAVSRQAFLDRGLGSAWKRVVALVVQPGVEYGNDFILDYDRSAAADLSRFIETETLVYEAHSTDYQSRDALRQMVTDHFAILKVGPALTFAYREAVFTLAMLENELYPAGERSNLVEVLDQVMMANPVYWTKYYPGDARAQKLARRFSFSDRSRYYWTNPVLQAAMERLFRNLRATQPPLSLISQYLPEQYEKNRYGERQIDPPAIIRDRIYRVLEDYRLATQR